MKCQHLEMCWRPAARRCLDFCEGVPDEAVFCLPMLQGKGGGGGARRAGGFGPQSTASRPHTARQGALSNPNAYLLTMLLFRFLIRASHSDPGHVAQRSSPPCAQQGVLSVCTSISRVLELVSLPFPHQSLEPVNNGRTAHVVRIPLCTVCLGSESFVC